MTTSNEFPKLKFTLSPSSLDSLTIKISSISNLESGRIVTSKENSENSENSVSSTPNSIVTLLILS